MNNAWMRVLEVTLSSQKHKKSLTFGTNWKHGKDDLNINITGNKYMSMLKDSFTIKISNLTYSEVIQIISGEFYDVEIRCGYRHGNIQTIFNGGVLYITNSVNSAHTNTIIILCASKVVARFGQSRMNLTLNSGINMYSALKFICRRAGINTANISNDLTKTFVQETINVNDTLPQWIEKLTDANKTFIPNADSSVNANNILSIFDAQRTNARVFNISNDNINMQSGYPRLTSDGLTITLLPTQAFMCGDVIQIDNSLLNISVRSQSEISKNYAKYFDDKGCYMIYQMQYNLTNRSSEFSVEITGKSRSLVSSFMGVK